MDIAEAVNILGNFCARRDIPSLSREALQEKYGISQADVMALFGGSILEGGRQLAEAMKRQLARKYVIVGGEGHTTETLRRKMHEEFPGILTEGCPEAQVFAAYLKNCHGLSPDYQECRSTNCGNNITCLLELLEKHHLPFKSILLVQDGTMQQRMDAGMRKHAPAGTLIINYAAYRAEVYGHGGSLAYREAAWGMWDMERYISLLLGEIPRLTDDGEGYGPLGKNFIAHVEIPKEVRRAFEALKEQYRDGVREADPLYASVR